MAKRHPAIPGLWLLTDARNDAALDRAMRRLPRGSGVIFRHYHLPVTARRARFARLAKTARSRGLVPVLAGSSRLARGWGAGGAYGAPSALGRPTGGLRLATAHSLRELAVAARGGADAVLLSPVFATRSHPGGKALGPVRFLFLARQSPLPVIALGGMSAKRARRFPVHGWAAIDAFA
ncbi:thiamine phosphate synthase [Novosphingobium sp. ZN18A2]|uniref:thiamine phosphate synthase n=1 Tax=Novosphingobium sp. ZN18A2 TaxID=3079861 RepID=UPI0030CC1313